jgi:hypothetical protein
MAPQPAHKSANAEASRVSAQSRARVAQPDAGIAKSKTNELLQLGTPNGNHRLDCRPA